MQTQWVTKDCWLGCGRTGWPVIWLGPVQGDGQHAPFMACADCLARLKAQALAYFMGRQPSGAPEPTPAPPVPVAPYGRPLCASGQVPAATAGFP